MERFAIITAMDHRQLNLFSSLPPLAGPSPPTDPARGINVDDMADAPLIDAISSSARADVVAAMAEVSRRRLTVAVPALAAVCRRFAGFGIDSPVAEQVAALEALSALGGPEAAASVARTIIRQEVRGPTLAVAISAAARLGAALPPAVIVALLRHDDPGIRADACRCARRDPTVVAALMELMDDLHADVRAGAACALGRLGWTEARQALVRLLEDAPTVGVIEALAGVADDDVVVLLGRVARARPVLADVVLAALDELGSTMAVKVANGLRVEQR